MSKATVHFAHNALYLCTNINAKYPVHQIHYANIAKADVNNKSLIIKESEKLYQLQFKSLKDVEFANKIVLDKIKRNSQNKE